MVFVPIRTPSMFHESIALLQLSYASICRWACPPDLGPAADVVISMPSSWGVNIFAPHPSQLGMA